MMRLARPLGISALVIVLDQLSKFWVLAHIQPYQLQSVIDGFFALTLAFNKGAAFSFLHDAGGWQRWFFVALALAAAGYIFTMLKAGWGSVMARFGLALVLGGALGNVIDRIRLGEVVDFLLFYWQTWRYPAFNIADSAICVGAVLLVLDCFLHKPAKG